MSEFIEINEELINLSAFSVIHKVNATIYFEIEMSGHNDYKVIEFDMIEDRDQEFDRISKVLGASQ